MTYINPPSGNGNVSAVGVGPWFIETQTMDIAYERVPSSARRSWEDGDITLSAITPVSGTFRNSHINVKVQARYTSTSSNSYFASGLQVPQKFTVYPVSADYLGHTYGAISNLSGHLGPQGAIKTTQEWYNRRLWVSGQDEEVDKTTDECWSYAASSMGTSVHATHLWNNFRDWASCDESYSFRSWHNLPEAAAESWTGAGTITFGAVGSYLPLYSLPGMYSVLQESNARAETISVVNEIADRVSNGLGLFSSGYADSLYVLGLNIPEYEAWRHDFS